MWILRSCLIVTWSSLILESTMLAETTDSNVCHSECSCVRTADHSLTATCWLNDIMNLSALITEPTNVTTLDLSYSSIHHLPDGVFKTFNSLRNLSLPSIGTSRLSVEMFSGLDRLQSLKLPVNKNQQWVGNFSSVLHSLTTIHNDGDHKWLPSNHLLEQRMITTITGVACDLYSGREYCTCMLCDLRKNLSDPELVLLGRDEPYIGRFARCIETYYTTSKWITTLARRGFRQFCSGSESECDPWRRDNRNPCFEVLKIVLYSQYIFGLAAVLLNGLVVVTIITSKTLRDIVSFLFTMNMALGDFLVGLNAIVITAVTQNAVFNEFHSRRGEWCRTRGLLWPMGSTLGIWTSAFMTTERFLAVKYSMNPDIRIRKDLALKLIVGSWVIAVASSLVPMAETNGYLYHMNDLCVPFSIKTSNALMLVCAALFTLPCILISFTTIPMYVNIFRVVKLSSSQLGVQREGSVARKIALLVYSNTVFFFLPTVLLIIFIVIRNIDEDILKGYAEYFVSGPVMFLCLNTNSVLNPLLYALRNPKFRQAMRTFTGGVKPRQNKIGPTTVLQRTLELREATKSTNGEYS